MSTERFDVADKLLREATTDAEFRSAASTAYMAAFQHVFGHPKVSSFQPTHTGADHQLLIRFLKDSDDAGLSRLGYSHLPRLRALRNHADYLQDAPFTRGLGTEAVELASEVIFDFLPTLTE